MRLIDADAFVEDIKTEIMNLYSLKSSATSMTTRNCWKVHDMEDQEYTDPYEQLATAWDEFKKAMWNEFESSKIGKFMFRLADRLAAWIERFGK